MAKNSSEKRICEVCNQKITDPDNYIGFGLLTRTKSQSLYKYNYKQFHLSHLANWVYLQDFVEELSKGKDLGLWKGKAIEHLLTQTTITLKSKVQ